MLGVIEIVGVLVIVTEIVGVTVGVGAGQVEIDVISPSTTTKLSVPLE
jgi:hypothetical protein